MAFINNNSSSTTSSSAGNSSVNEEFLKCDKKSCIFNTEGDRCSLAFCFFDDTEFKLQKETFEYECRICSTKTTGDSRNAVLKVCDHCLQRMKEMGSLKACKICSRPMDPKKADLWETGICNTCRTRLTSVLTSKPRICPLCSSSHTSMPVPLTNICSSCASILRKVIKKY